MANHALADRGAEQPESYREAFERLGKLGIVPPELSATLQQVAAMRNILVHGYLVGDPAKANAVVVHRLPDLERFAACMARLL